MIQTYDISQLRPYINWPYFFFAWQVKDPSEKERLRQESEVFLEIRWKGIIMHMHSFCCSMLIAMGMILLCFEERGTRNVECGMRNVE